MSEKFICPNRNEEYIERCGEVFRTNLNGIVIHCTMCDDKFREFNIFVTHLFEEHNATDTQPLILEDVNRENRRTLNESCIQNDFVDKDLLSLFDLTYLDEVLMNNDEDVLDKDIETLFEALTGNEVELETTVSSEVREVRKCNVQTSIAERPHKCQICGLRFKDKTNMQHHIKRHSTERNHECSECKKKFYTAYELKIHTSVHTGVRPFLCPDCGRTFRTKALLLSHKKRHTNQRDFKCLSCGKGFYEKRNLEEHMLIHNTEKQFACSLCDAVFLLRKSLFRHKRAHENRKAYKCEVCNATFVQERALNSHMKKKHKEHIGRQNSETLL